VFAKKDTKVSFVKRNHATKTAKVTDDASKECAYATKAGNHLTVEKDSSFMGKS